MPESLTGTWDMPHFHIPDPN